MFLHKKGIDRTQTFALFSSSDLELAKMILGQNHDTPADHKQSLCVEGTSNVSP